MKVELFLSSPSSLDHSPSTDEQSPFVVLSQAPISASSGQTLLQDFARGEAAASLQSLYRGIRVRKMYTQVLEEGNGVSNDVNNYPLETVAREVACETIQGLWRGFSLRKSSDMGNSKGILMNGDKEVIRVAVDEAVKGAIEGVGRGVEVARGGGGRKRWKRWR